MLVNLENSGIAAGCLGAQRPDALGDEINGKGQFGVLGFEHQVQGLEHRAGDVPVVVVRLEIQRVSVGQKAREALGDADASISVNSDPAWWSYVWPSLGDADAPRT
jgi:hypothetical protein